MEGGELGKSQYNKLVFHALFAIALTMEDHVCGGTYLDYNMFNEKERRSEKK